MGNFEGTMIHLIKVDFRYEFAFYYYYFFLENTMFFILVLRNLGLKLCQGWQNGDQESKESFWGKREVIDYIDSSNYTTVTT